MKVFFLILFISASVYSQGFTVSKTDSDSLWNDIDEENKLKSVTLKILIMSDIIIIFEPGETPYGILWDELTESTRIKLIKRSLLKS